MHNLLLGKINKGLCNLVEEQQHVVKFPIIIESLFETAKLAVGHDQNVLGIFFIKKVVIQLEGII